MLVRRPVSVRPEGMLRPRSPYLGTSDNSECARCICLFLLIPAFVALSMRLYMSRLHPAVRPRMLLGLPSRATRYFFDFVMVIR